MYFDFNLKSTTLLIFLIHGIAFSILFARRGFLSEQKSNFWLSLYILLCALYIAPFMFGYSNWYAKDGYREVLFFVPFQQLFLLPPVIYFYIKTVLYPSFTLSKKEFVHFIPAIIYALYSLVIFVTDVYILDTYYFYEDGRDKDFDLWYQISGFISMIYYLMISLKMYDRYRKTTYQTVSYADAILYKWVQHFLIAFLLLLCIRTLFFIINPEWGGFGKKYWYYLCFSILFYYISISGLIHSIKSNIAYQISDIFYPSIQENVDTSPVISKEQIAEDSHSNELKEQLEEMMNTQKAFANPTITLFDLAQDLNTTPKMISQVINKGFQMNFNDFINTYRTEEVIAKLTSGESNSQTLLGITLDSGFNSKSTFNRAFKKHTQLTPKEYIKKNIAK